jgi:hypothetical protein
MLNKYQLQFALSVAVLAVLSSSNAFSQIAHEASTVTTVAVNGGADTPNPGVTCIQVTPPPPNTQCTQGFIGIPNNNKLLVNAALTAKSIGVPVRVYFFVQATDLHCPGNVFTKCSLNNLDLK